MQEESAFCPEEGDQQEFSEAWWFQNPSQAAALII
jgi:hypothetical protein